MDAGNDNCFSFALLFLPKQFVMDVLNTLLLTFFVRLFCESTFVGQKQQSMINRAIFGCSFMSPKSSFGRLSHV